jgi:hypothetical protein
MCDDSRVKLEFLVCFGNVNSHPAIRVAFFFALFKNNLSAASPTGTTTCKKILKKQ